jgi:pseudo-rSAM protein
MKPKKSDTDYWFTIEPYVFVNITNKYVLLYSTLDGASLESDKVEVIKLLRETFQKENCGVVLLKDERYEQKDINVFIRKLREKYMGDIIDVALSNGKPVQLFPYFNYLDKHEIYKNIKSVRTNVLGNLFEISIHVNTSTNLTKLISFLRSIQGISIFNLIGNIGDMTNYNELLSFFDQDLSAAKYIHCSYTNVIPLQPAFKNNFSYRISVHFPIDMKQWDNSRKILLNQTLPYEYIFDVLSTEDCLLSEQFIDRFQIEKYQLNPVYTGDNIRFFEESVFLSKEDILATSMTIKDFFAHQSMNIFDFGKIHIMPNGDVYANINHPALGNICTHSIHEIVYNEIKEGISWFHIRNEAPCSSCVYQWLCPPPSNYEIVIGRPNLCHVNNKITE